MKIKIELWCDNSAFWDYADDEQKPHFDYAEVRRVLNDVVHELQFETEGKCRDVNGNVCGLFTFDKGA
jgi:hypothetical protein